MTNQGLPPTSFKELLRRYQSGERDFSGAELDIDPDLNLDGVTLDGVNLSHAFVVASFRGASLRGARFCHSNMKTCDFRGADLRDSDFRGAALCSTNFEGARLEDSYFEGAYEHSHVYKAHERPDTSPPPPQPV